MRLTKRGHACVELTAGPGDDRGKLVVDPGSLSEADALTGAAAALITHEHFDHLDEDRLRQALAADPRLEVWTNRAVASRLADIGRRVHAVSDGEEFTAAGHHVRVFGSDHAVVHRDIPVVPNVGFLIDGEVFHPGDAFTLPAVDVPTLLVPTQAPWMKAAEMIDYVVELRPRRAYSVHDGFLNEAGLDLVDGLLGRVGGKLGIDCRRLHPGDGVTLGSDSG